MGRDFLPRRVIAIDLTSGKVREEVWDDASRRTYFGGRGAAVVLLDQRQFWRHDPLDPASPFVIAAGLLNGSPWPASSRVHMAFRSPLTGLYGYANAGGSLGPRLTAHGIVALVLEGKAEKPSVLRVDEAGIRIEAAGDLWGATVPEATEALRAGGMPAVACIGPAGERGVALAAVMVDVGRAAARCGGGAVLGSKNVKAVVVAGGRWKRFPSEFTARSRSATERILATPGVQELARWGTPFLVGIKNARGDLPARNHRRGQVPFVDAIDADALEPYRIESKGCHGCPIRCGRISEVRSGAHRSRSAGPEYESLAALGANCWCGDLEAILHANALCNELGLDSISVGATIAFAMECHERGLLKTASHDLSWGRGDTIVELIESLARREGIGELLAGGVRAAAAALGPAAAPYALHVKGLEIPGQEPRVAKAFGLGHATSNRGADHLYALPTIDVANLEQAARNLLPDAYPQVLDPADEATKPALVRLGEDYCAVSDALGVCKFTTAEVYALEPAHLAEALTAAGLPFDADELLEVGERIVNLERVLNARFGIDASADVLPARFTEEPLPVERGAAREERRIDSLPKMLAEYYRLRGWGKDGLPTAATLRRLGLPGRRLP
jgi:aldehyde:ferredoxin oxidoreductase